MRKSLGYGAYDRFGEDIAAPDKNLYKGADPIRFGRGSLEIRAQGGEGPSYKRYTFEGGMTPFGILIMAVGGSAFIYFVYRITGKVLGFAE